MKARGRRQTRQPGSQRLTAVLAGQAAFALTVLVVAIGLWTFLRQSDLDAATTGDMSPAEALAVVLEAGHGLSVEPDQVVFLEDPTARPWTRGLGFVPAFALARAGSADDGNLEDLYYIEVRTTATGSPLDVRRVSNLTKTPYAREQLVVTEGFQTLLSVDVFGQIQSLLLVDFTGDEREVPGLDSLPTRVQVELTNLQETGRTTGVGMRLYRLDPPAKAVEASVDGAQLRVVIHPVDGSSESPETVLNLDPRTGALEADEGNPGRATYLPRYYAAKQTVPWLVDSIRGLSFVGPRKIAALEKFVFTWVDRSRQTAFSVGLIGDEGTLMDELGSGAGQGVGFEDFGGKTSSEWPPPPVKPAVSDPKPGEGKWQPADIPWLRTLPGAPPAFLKTAVRMDPKRPYSNLVLIAMDMRQLDFGMVAGTITPEPSFGQRGTGLIPRDADTMGRLVAAFNGGFKTAHGAFGMMVDRTVILPAMPYAATFAVNADGTMQMGSWNNSMDVPETMRSFRQNLPPLMADGKFNPTRKRKWGGTASDLDNVNTTRSAMCFRGENTLVYVWGRDTSADALGRAMLALGCEYGMHLDMNPTHTGWSFYRAEAADVDPKGKAFKHQVHKGSPTMDFDEDRFINREVKDVFYLMLRHTLASELPAPPEGFGPWTTDHAPTGAEGFLPVAAVAVGNKAGDLLVAADLTRLRVQFRRGTREPDPTQSLGSGVTPLPPLKLSSPTMVLDLGVTSLQAPDGFISGGKIFTPLLADHPALVRDTDGELELVDAEAVSSLSTDATDIRGGSPLVVGGVARGAQGSESEVSAVGVDALGHLYLIEMNGVSPREVARRLVGLKVVTALRLSASPRRGRRLSFLEVRDGAGVEVDPVGGAVTPLANDRGLSTQLFFEGTTSPPRVTRLRMQDITLSGDEAKRQRRLVSQIKAMRQELRAVENAKYKKFIEKLKARRGDAPK